MLNYISSKPDNLFLSIKVLKLIKYYNIVILSLYVLGSFAFLFDIKFYMYIHMVLVALLGFNLFSLIPVGYIMAKFKFCKWSRMAFISNIIICILYLFIQLLKIIFSLLDIVITVNWDEIILTTISSILLTSTLKYLIWNKSLSS